MLEILLVNACLILGAMFLLWLVSLKVHDASIVDPFWGLGFVLVAWTSVWITGVSTRGVTLAVLTTLWGLRLSIYLAWRNLGHGEDKRYQAMRRSHGRAFWWVSLLTVFGLQGVVMWVVSLPLQIGSVVGGTLALWNQVGLVVWLIGFLFETIGDWQLATFIRRRERSDGSNSSTVLDTGLWRFSRHPNYFGNALVWWGLFMVSVTPQTVWLIISPILMTFLLIKVSGVALLEKDLAQRSEEYRDYVRRTSPFVPLPPRRPGNDSKSQSPSFH